MSVDKKIFENKNLDNKLEILVDELSKTGFSSTTTMVKMLKFLVKNEGHIKRFQWCAGTKNRFTTHPIAGKLTTVTIETSCSDENNECIGNYERFEFLVETLPNKTKIGIVYFIPEIEYAVKKGVIFIRDNKIESDLDLNIGDFVLLLYNKISAKG